MDKAHNINKHLISELQHRNSELEKRNSSLEEELKDTRKMLSSLERSRLSPVKEDKLHSLQEKLKDLAGLVGTDKMETTRRKSQEAAATLERLKLEHELKLQDVSWELSRKDQQLAQLTQNMEQLQTALLQSRTKNDELTQNNDSLSKMLAATSDQLIARRI